MKAFTNVSVCRNDYQEYLNLIFISIRLMRSKKRMLVCYAYFYQQNMAHSMDELRTLSSLFAIDVRVVLVFCAVDTVIIEVDNLFNNMFFRLY